MKLLTFLFAISLFFTKVAAQQCRFEKTGGKESATYFEAVDWYKDLDKVSAQVTVKEMGMTDAGYLYVNLDDCWHGGSSTSAAATDTASPRSQRRAESLAAASPSPRPLRHLRQSENRRTPATSIRRGELGQRVAPTERSSPLEGVRR